jgi:(5-formylfuran-3-yl)methyl phosphate synthase
MQLMISVVSAGEALEALAGGADILDVKNPDEGSLGAQFPRVIQQIRHSAPRPAKVSAAIGDMPNLPGTAALAAFGAAACGADYVKVGLYGPKTQTEALLLLQEVKQAINGFPDVAVIAGGYADSHRAGTLNPLLLPAIALEAGVAGCLLDTAIKDGRGLFDFLTPQALQTLADEAHNCGLLFALAGGLQAQDLSTAHDLGADVVGIRTAACQDDRRNGPLDAGRVRRLRQAIALPA